MSVYLLMLKYSLRSVIRMFNKGSDDVIQLVLYCIDDEYRESHPDVLKKAKDTGKTWARALGVAKQNELTYYLSKTVIDHEGMFPARIPEVIVKDEKEKQSRLGNTLNFVSSLFKDEELSYRFIKLYRGIQYNPRDVDVLTRKAENSRVTSAFKRRSATLMVFDEAEINCEKKGLLKVDLYNGFYYFSREFLDNDFLWADPREVEICGVECPILSYEADLATLLIHSMLGHRYLSLLDFLYAKSLLLDRKLNLDKIAKQAKKYEWEHAFSRMIHTLEDAYRALYVDDQVIGFPIVFPPSFTLKLFVLDPKRKITFIASSLIDRVLYGYGVAQTSAGFELPEALHDVVLRLIRRVKYWVGDRKGITKAEIVD